MGTSKGAIWYLKTQVIIELNVIAHNKKWNLNNPNLTVMKIIYLHSKWLKKIMDKGKYLFNFYIYLIRFKN